MKSFFISTVTVSPNATKHCGYNKENISVNSLLIENELKSRFIGNMRAEVGNVFYWQNIKKEDVNGYVETLSITDAGYFVETGVDIGYMGTATIVHYLEHEKKNGYVKKFDILRKRPPAILTGIRGPVKGVHISLKSVCTSF